jgi:amino acid adenylation domain-containing protein
VSAQAQANPYAPAIVDGQHVLSYRDLDARSTQLARRLRSLGVGPDVVVGACLGRSMSMIVAALGILKAGGAYVPLDPSYPLERLDFMLRDARPGVVVTGRAFTGRLPQGKWDFLTLESLENLARNGPPPFTLSTPASDSLAYVIYTSGSSGTPKGVEISHSSLSNLVSWHQRAFELEPSDRATHLASPSFDAAVWEVWPYLAMGASIYLPNDSVRAEPEALRDWLVARRITISFVPTPLAERLLILPWPPQTALRVLLTGGDWLQHYPPGGLPFQLVNNYGPTESTVVATSGVVTADDRPSPSPPIGRPIAGTEILILDENMQPVPAGTAGEICIGGAGLARGYRNRPRLTREKFVFGCEGMGARDRLYKTGDLARWLPDGQIEFLGRADDQVKIRGFRIELNEITAALNRHPSIQASMAVARPNEEGEKSLVAYVVMAPGVPASAAALQNFLRSQLPPYMLPTVFVRLDSFPMTLNGKVDRAALPGPDASNILRDAPSPHPLDGVEQEVANLVAGLLELEAVGRDDNFFLLGGHSLLGSQLIMKIRATFGVDLSLAMLFDNPTIGAIAEIIHRLVPPKDLPINDKLSTLPEAAAS